MLRIKRSRARQPIIRATAAAVILLLMLASACSRSKPATERLPITLRIGLGLTAGATGTQRALELVARNIALEGLVSLPRDGRAVPRLAESWSVSQDGLTWRLRLHPHATFHSGKPANAEVVRNILQTQLPQDLGPAFEDIASIRAVSDFELEVSLRHRSTFLIERLDDQIQEPGAALSGTGPYHVSGKLEDQLEMSPNDTYYAGKTDIDKILIKPYSSVRAAWADILRDQIDMLYDVGIDALKSLSSSNEVR